MTGTFILFLAAAVLIAALAPMALLWRRKQAGVRLDAFDGVSIGLFSLVGFMALATLFLVSKSAPNSTQPPAPSTPSATTPQVSEAELNRPAPNFRFRLVEDDAPRDLAAYRGRVVLLNFWATWCAPCLMELPELNRLQEAYHDRGLVVLTVSDEPRADLQAFQKSTPVRTVSAYIDAPSDLPEPFSRTIEVRPTTYIVDREGVLRAYAVGAGTFEGFERALMPYLEAEIASR